MGTQKTPTVPFTIPMFSAFISRWKELAQEKSLWDDIIQPGLKKLDEYEQELEKAPAYSTLHSPPCPSGIRVQSEDSESSPSPVRVQSEMYSESEWSPSPVRAQSELR